MSYEVFDRRYSLIIGRPASRVVEKTVPRFLANKESLSTNARYLDATKTIKDTVPSSDTVVSDFRTIPEEFKEIRDLSMKAKIVYKKGGSKGGNQFSTISLDNLEEDFKNFIKVDDLIFLRAGYKLDRDSNNTPYEDLPLLLSAQITKVETKRVKNTGTFTTDIICGDNILPSKSAKVSMSWPPNTTKRQVLDDLVQVASNFYVPIGSVFEELDGFISPLKEVYPTGYSVAGNLFDELNKAAESIDYRFYTVLGKMYIEPIHAVKKREYFKVTPETLKEPIQGYSDKSNGSKEGKSAPNGITLSMFLNGRITTNKAIEVVGDEKWEGSYPIESVSHNLDFEGNSWNTTVKATVVS